MPFDQQNSDYEKQYHSIFRKELVADRDNKILKEGDRLEIVSIVGGG